MPIITSLRSQPILLLLLTLSLSAILASSLLANQHNIQRQALHSQHYGQAMANMAAQQAVDATLNHDLISLQVILSDITKNNGIKGATIHDVENRLLVQGGHLPSHERSASQHNNTQSFTAPITLHDSVAGYVTVTLSNNNSHSDRLLLWKIIIANLILLLIAIGCTLLWSKLNTRTQNERSALTDNNADDSTDHSIENATGRTTESSTSGSTAHHLPIIDLPSFDDSPERSSQQVQLLLSCRNLDSLHKQLNSQSFATLLSRFEQQLQGVLTLYSGSLANADTQAWHNNTLSLLFKGSDLDDCGFRALCSAQLLLTLASQQQGPQLQLAAIATAVTKPSSLLTQFQQNESRALQTQETQEIHIARTLLSEKLQQRVEMEEQGEYNFRLNHIKAPYQALLARQEQQLLSL